MTYSLIQYNIAYLVDVSKWSSNFSGGYTWIINSHLILKQMLTFIIGIYKKWTLMLENSLSTLLNSLLRSVRKKSNDLVSKIPH